MELHGVKDLSLLAAKDKKIEVSERTALTNEENIEEDQETDKVALQEISDLEVNIQNNVDFECYGFHLFYST